MKKEKKKIKINETGKIIKKKEFGRNSTQKKKKNQISPQRIYKIADSVFMEQTTCLQVTIYIRLAENT